MILEATILSEKEPRNVTLDAGEEKEDGNVNAGNEDTEVSDKMVEDEISTYTRNKLSNVEIFYMECTLKNPNNIWNEFTFVDNSSFDMTKVIVF